jgi:hypothetical protein
MNQVQDLLASERARLSVLEAEVAERKTFIAALEARLARDPIDALLDGRIADSAPIRALPARQKPPFVATVDAGQGLADPFLTPTAEASTFAINTPRQLSGKETIMSVLTARDQETGEIVAALGAIGISMNSANLRTQLWHLKNDGLVESPRKGVFRLSPKAVIDGKVKRMAANNGSPQG